MKLETLHKKYDKMQKIYGDPSLKAIYHGGCENKPKICFIFMNPTSRNLASTKEWKGIRAPWIGTKVIWGLFNEIGLLDDNIYREIKEKKTKEWDEEFAKRVYDDVRDKKYFITNLGKCNQLDARPLPDSIYNEYLDLLKKEIEIIEPEIIVTFGNQVSSILLGKKISVSDYRGKSENIKIGKYEYPVFPIYYPVGNGRFNMPKSIEDLKIILNSK